MTQAYRGRTFLAAIQGFEAQLARLLALLLVVAIGCSAVQLLLPTADPLRLMRTNWFDGSLLTLLDRVLLILIALEVLQTVTACLRDRMVQIELVLLTALTAVARRLIVLPAGAAGGNPLQMVALGMTVLGLAVAFRLVRKARPPLDLPTDEGTHPSDSERRHQPRRLPEFRA